MSQKDKVIFIDLVENVYLGKSVMDRA